ncbi:ATP-binding protein [Lactobacillus sp. LC28-10]|uniref:ATP-binding protein n=1 Tax=Secundilactobacillus angelensis TaxID=2722706 RepID=A0ABX1KX91_9LACO|nr:ATP-binding protein [Secundilactobacillus angelensis]MCH5461412.1 ATP-binding protein [Secundilactobacillus angelensis]NLR17775.1 ATP-binding protein [Secundilactobacillus angelensis]
MIERPEYLEQLIRLKDNDMIKVITGVRRSGKSVLLMLYRDYLLAQGIIDENIIYYNFESLEVLNVRDADQLRDLLLSKLKKGVHQYVMLDEIQMVAEWQQIVNAIRVSYDCDIVITGSNAKMLSGELATLLSGRYVEIRIYPFSFKEYLAAIGVDKDSNQISKAFDNFERFGGFPAVVLSGQTIKDTMLQGISDSIILNDVATRANIRDVETLKALVSFLTDNIGQLVNLTKIANTLKSEGINTNVHTLENYLTALENAFLFYRVRQYNIRGRAYLKTSGKYFIVDPGLRRIGISRRPGNFAGQLENIVYIELLRRGYAVDVGKIDQQEIDFVARKSEDLRYIQVTYELPQNTHETDNLLKITDNYKKTLITQQYYPDIKLIDGVEVVNVMDWLLDDERY